MVSLSIVIPAFNEEPRLAASLERVLDYLQARDLEAEVIVVDDGSRDGTAAVAESFAPRGVRLLRLPVNGGKGAALRVGVQASVGELVLLSDADLSTPIDDLARLEGALPDVDLVFGSREAAGAEVTVRQPRYRERMGKTFNLIVRALGLATMRDTQCGFKLLRGEVARELFAALTIARFAWDVELLWLARRRGLRVAEVGVRWAHAAQSRVHPLRDACSMLFDVVRLRWRGLVVASCALLAGVGTVACSGQPAVPGGFDLAALVAKHEFTLGETPPAAGLALAREPVTRRLVCDLVRSEAVVTSAAGWSWRGQIPRGGQLWLTTQRVAAPAAPPGPAVPLEVVVDEGRGERQLARLELAPGAPWQGLAVDLSELSGKTVTLAARLGAKAGELAGAAEVAWAEVVLATPRTDPRPDIVLIIIDTLRADHTTPYGYRRATTPALERLVAARGVTVERAYAQAPWTLPSMASLMTGVMPGRFFDERSSGGFALPEGLPSLAERLAAVGYRTAAFVGNPTLYEGNGFARGWTTFYVAPYELSSMNLHAEEVTRRAVPWLRRAPRDRPYLLWVHYLDPHDPYESPEVVDGRSPFLLASKSRMRGNEVHALYAGQRQLDDPQADLEQLTALYDAEISYADRHAGELLEAIPAPRLADTLIAVTSDHGEELFDHGGWKHGQTLYEEQVRVPLLLRWDARLPPGRSLAGTAALLDLVPTLTAAAEAPAAGDGIDLLPHLAGQARLPRRAITLRHLSSGPLRAAIVVEDEKLALFNSEQPLGALDALAATLARRDRERLAPAALFDLARDRGERGNLLATRAEAAKRLHALLEQQLDKEIPGLRLAATAGPGQRLGVRLTCADEPGEVSPWFLLPGERLSVRRRVVEIALNGPGLPRGGLLSGCTALDRIAVEVDGVPIPPERILLGRGERYASGAVEAAALAGGAPAADESGVVVRCWRPQRRDRQLPSRDQETEKRLRALGYLQ